MRRFLLCSLVSGLLMAASSLSARACINDREVNNAESEFKSQYRENSVEPSAAPSPASTGDQFKEYGPLALGGVLFVGAMVQVRRRSKTRQS